MSGEKGTRDGANSLSFADEEERNRRIHIEIKPLSNGAPMSASVDELRATIGSLSLSPIPQHSVSSAVSLFRSVPLDINLVEVKKVAFCK